MQKKLASAAFILLVCLSACSKHDSSPSGLSVDGGTAGPSNTWLSGYLVQKSGNNLFTEVRFNSDHSVSKVITLNMPDAGETDSLGNPIDTTYTTIIPVYSGGKLSELQSPADSNAASGPVTTNFDYASNGDLLRIRYNPGTNTYAYDSLVLATGGMLAMSYHFVLDSSTGVVSEQYWDTFSWTSKKDISQVLVSTASSAYTVSYTYDGYYNPYKTVKDLPFMLGTLDNIVPLLSANNAITDVLVGYNSETTYAYQYNNSSVPVSQNISVIVSGSTKQSTFVYFQYIQ
ncbi:hypothetical protein [Dinghuibacter silviterrae]|uniref:YD repeat-containing protein n=1 Tax=Dinghuibacter silviterrae TaxID=1539049 RepID=A0A4R8DJY8_9BACT|nr:hypothetical protein [Dinghuibacter silviterrae]TDW97320.1 hypothetical protein EDB95_5167 [Dinghuibacter silviterrae]